MSFFLLLSTKEDILTTKQLMVDIDFHSMGKENTTMVANGYSQLFGYQNTFFCVQQKKYIFLNNLRLSKWWQNLQ